MADLLGGAVVGALVSEALKSLIKEAKKYKDFKPLSEELVSTIDRLLPEILEIESMQKEQEFGVGELKELMDTIEKARALIDTFPGVGFFDKPKYTKKIRKINAAMDNFYDKILPLLQYKNQVTLVGKTGNIEDKVDGLHEKVDSITAAAPSVFRNRCSVPELKKVPVGFDLPLMKLKEKLLDVAVVNIVVTAPPGCGKTTLVTHLCHDKDVKEKFKHIFFCVVSSTPNFKAMVQDLLQHNGYQPLTFNNNSQASNGLSELLEKLKGDDILLVLDDVWSGSESFLENFPTDIPNLKILVTSRSRLLGFGYSYHLKPLKDEYAETLLVQYAPCPDNASPAQYKDLLQKILKRCNGFPLVIKVVGASLKNRPLTHWQAQVIIWSTRYTVLDNPHPEVIDCLQPSLDALNSDLKQCFLDMGLFLEDQKIRSWIIIEIWVELYGNGIQTEKEKIILCLKYLDDLAAHNLLDIVPIGKKEHEDGFYYEFFVSQHDILRELAIRQSKSEVERKRLNLEIREDKFPDWCLNGPINASLLSISTDDLFSSNWVEMDCPNVEALVLNFSSSNYALPSFIAGMTKLKVLIIKNHGFSLAREERLRNFQCLSSLPNLKRIRLETVSITLLDLPQLRLGSLEKISFLWCSFGEVFYDCVDIDIPKPLPSLQEIDIDYCNDLFELPYWVSEVVSLKTLSITSCSWIFRLPEAIGNLSKLEVLRLSCCDSLCELPESTDRLSNLRFLDISHCSRLRKLPIEIGKLQKLKKISMMGCWKCQLPDSVINLEDLEVNCDEKTASLWGRLKPEMRNLSVHVGVYMTFPRDQYFREALVEFLQKNLLNKINVCF